MIAASVTLDERPQDLLQVLRMRWEASITGHYGGSTELILPDDLPLDTGAMVGRRISVRFTDDEAPGQGSFRAGIIRAVEQDHDLETDFHILRLDVRPRLIRLDDTEHCWTYRDKTVEEIITEVLDRNRYEPYEFRIDDDYPPIAFVAQFDESDLAFIHRMAEYWGLCAALEPHGDEDRLVFADDPRAFTAIPGATLPYRKTGYRFGVTRLTRQINALPVDVMLRNYVHDRPEDALVVTEAVPFGSEGRLIEHDHNFRTVDGDGRLLARIRAEELSARRMVYRGEAASVALRTGSLCTITDHPVWGDIDLLITTLDMRYEATPFLHGGGEPPKVTQAFTAMPLTLEGTPLHYRPPRVTPKPSIQGVLHGITEESDDRLNRLLDEEGSYQVRLLAHGTDEGEVKALYPRVRMAQPVGSANRSGFHFPLHPGTEVLLAFVDGDPDRPFICGTVPNPRDVSVTTSHNATKNIVRTAAGTRLEFENGPLSGGGGGYADGPFIIGKLHVPYEESRTGSYLRLGRADGAEYPESRGPGHHFPRDGWYDFTNGYRSRVTMLDEVDVQGGQTTIHQHADYFHVKYTEPLAPISGASPSSDTALGGSGAPAEAATAPTPASEPAEEPAPGTPVTITAQYDSLIGSHNVTATKANTSTYTMGTAYIYFGGARMLATYGAQVSNFIGLQYSATAAVKTTFDLSLSTSITAGYKYDIDFVHNLGATIDDDTRAAKSITLSVRNPPAEAGWLATHKALGAIAGGLAAAATVTDLTLSTTLATQAKEDWIGERDAQLNLARASILSSAVLAAIVTAVSMAWSASRILTDSAGFGGQVKLDPNAARIKSGVPTGAMMAMSTGIFSNVPPKAELKIGNPYLPLSRVTVDPLGAAMVAGLTTHVSVRQGWIDMFAGTSGISITPAGTFVYGPLIQGPPLMMPPTPIVPEPPEAP